MHIDILMIDDDRDLSRIACKVLTKYGYQVQACFSAEEAYDLMSQGMPRLIVLDINLPGDNGFTFCKEIRTTSTVPILFVSARTSENDRINGLELGADDYISKPYSLQELLSRVKATLRRTYGFTPEDKEYEIQDITIDSASRMVMKGSEEVKLSLREYDILLYLVEHPEQAITKEELFTQVWGSYSETELASLAVHIRWLRQKIEQDPSNPKHICTVWGLGYIFHM